MRVTFMLHRLVDLDATSANNHSIPSEPQPTEAWSPAGLQGPSGRDPLCPSGLADRKPSSSGPVLGQEPLTKIQKQGIALRSHGAYRQPGRGISRHASVRAEISISAEAAARTRAAPAALQSTLCRRARHGTLRTATTTEHCSPSRRHVHEPHVKPPRGSGAAPAAGCPPRGPQRGR